MCKNRICGMIAVAVLATSFTGCQQANNTQSGAVLGTGLGALTGAIIGNQTGDRDKGALIGALAGGAAGALAGQAQDNAEQRDAVMAHAAHQEQMRYLEGRAVTNSDVVAMSANGLSEPLIIGTIQDRGGKFDTSPQAIIQLKQSGISDGLISAMQRYNMSP